MVWASRSGSLSPMKSDTLCLLFPELTWERHAVVSPPVQCQRHLVPSVHAIHCQYDLIPGAVGQARQRLLTSQTRRSTHRVEDLASMSTSWPRQP
jgi:hypothetical protein